jgi:N-acetyl-anhydromuramyl-L-alanine amidase AmpD
VAESRAHLKHRVHRTERRLKRRQAAYERAHRQHLPDEVKRRHRRDKTTRTLRALKAQLAKLRKAQHGSSKAHPPKADLTIIGNHSSRGGVKPHIMVLHITVSHNRAGKEDVRDILTYFQRVEASAHRVIDFEGFVGHGVNDGDKAWTQAAYNAGALSIELISYTDLSSPEEWHKQAGPALEKIAQQLAYWSVAYDIPLTHSTVHGVCQHRNLGAAGGGHTDIGNNFPEKFVVERAQTIKRSWGH